jgi:hypothetical protein
MRTGDLSLVGVSILTLITVLLFLIVDHPLFIVLLTLCFGVIGYITYRKEPEPEIMIIEN